MVPALARLNVRNPSLSSDGMTLYVTRDSNLYSVHRAARDQPWEATMRLEAVLSTGNENRVSTSSDDLFAVFASSRSGTTDLWTSERATPTTSFDAPTQAYVDGLRSPIKELDPELSADALRLYYAPYDGTNQHILVASRTDRTKAFSAPAVMTELQISIAVADPTLSPDELVIAFSSGAEIPDNDLFYAVRSERSEAFDSIDAIPALNLASAGEWDVELSSDGCEIYFVSDRSGSVELYAASISQ